MKDWAVVFTEEYKGAIVATSIAGSLESLTRILFNITGETVDPIMEYYWITQHPYGKEYKRTTGEVVKATALPVLT